MKLLLHVSNQISCSTEALSFSMQFLHIGTGHASEQLPQNIRGLDSDQAPKGRVQLFTSWAEGSAWCLSLRLGQGEFLSSPAGDVCVVEDFCCQVKQMQEEVSRVHGIRDDKKEIESSPRPRRELIPPTLRREGQAVSAVLWQQRLETCDFSWKEELSFSACRSASVEYVQCSGSRWEAGSSVQQIIWACTMQ